MQTFKVTIDVDVIDEIPVYEDQLRRIITAALREAVPGAIISIPELQSSTSPVDQIPGEREH